MWALLFLSLIHSVFSTEGYVCSAYDAAGCVNLTMPPCRADIKTCYVHPNVCGSLRRLLITGYIGSGWKIVISTYSFQCTSAVMADCVNATKIAQSTPLVSPLGFCIPINTHVYQPNVAISVLGTQSARIFTPLASPSVLSCTILAFTGPNVSLSNLIIDATNCNTGLPDSTIGVSISDSGLSLKNILFKATPVMVALNGSSCDNILFDTVTLSNPPTIFSFTLPIAIAAGVCTNTVPITATPSSLQFLAVISSSATLVDTTAFTVFDFGSFNQQYVYQPYPMNCSAYASVCPKTTANWIYIVIPLVLILALILIFSCSHLSHRIQTELPLMKTK